LYYLQTSHESYYELKALYKDKKDSIFTLYKNSDAERYVEINKKLMR